MLGVPATGVHFVLVQDETLLGAQAVAHQAYDIACNIAATQALPLDSFSTLEFGQAIDSGMTVIDALCRIVETIARVTPQQNSVLLVIYLNAHSRLWENNDPHSIAQQQACQCSFPPTQETRFSTVMYRNSPVLGAQEIARLLCSLPACVAKCVLVLDTCHSMSLVSSLLYPARDIRVIHSTGEKEKTYQTPYGSVLSSALSVATAQAKAEMDHVRKTSTPVEIAYALSTALWRTIQLCAASVSFEVLTSGPGDALRWA